MVSENKKAESLCKNMSGLCGASCAFLSLEPDIKLSCVGGGLAVQQVLRLRLLQYPALRLQRGIPLEREICVLLPEGPCVYRRVGG